MSSARIVTLCTGNAARSVMLGFMLSELAELNGLPWQIRTAGTHVSEGQAISPRTLEAMIKIEDLGQHHFTAHRSHQLIEDDVNWADVIVAVEADHVAYVHAHFPEARDKVVQLRAFCVGAPLDEPFPEQVRKVAAVHPNDELDVADPAGGEQADYDRCALDLWDMSQVFTALATGDELA